MVTENTSVEEILDEHPECIAYFIERGLSPYTCAGAYPSTLGEWLKIRGVVDIDGFVAGLGVFLGGDQRKEESCGAEP